MAGVSKSGGVRKGGTMAEGNSPTGGSGSVRQGGTIAQGSGKDSENRQQYHTEDGSGRLAGKPSKSKVRGG